ncbi:MAG TPA: DUF333 domain-containing protein [Terriglobales bacterium]|nr:DUF333 domain-containing protein [Terriglobales bacterium]
MSVLLALHKRRLWLLATGLLVVVSALAVEAQESKPGEESDANERLLQLAPASIPALTPYLELNQEQQDKFNELQKSYFASLISIQGQAKLSEDEKFEKSTVLTQDTTNQMMAALSKEQQQRVPATLELFASLRALRIPTDVAGDLKLTPEQRTQIISLAQEMRQQIRALPAEDRRSAKGFTVMKESNAKLQAVLTPQQKALLEADPRNATLANPASVNCGKRGGKTVIRKKADGSEYGVCVFPNGAECEEWALLRGQCSPETAKKP